MKKDTTSNANKPSLSFIVYLGILVATGFLILSSASSVIGFATFGDSYYFVKHQLVYGLLPGLFLFFIFSRIRPEFWKKNSGYLFIGSLLLLLLVFVPGLGVEYNSARSWVLVFGYSLQPAEIVKLALIIYLAAWFSRTEKKDNFRHLVSFLVILGIVCGLVALQPDMGTMMIIVLIGLGIYFISGARLKYLFAISVLGGVGLVGLIKLAPYRMQRLAAFLDPSLDPQGIGYHINQALIAIGSGGFFGAGLGHSRQKFQYLPEVAGDSIFAVLAEELGFALSLLFVIIYIWFVVTLFKKAKAVDDLFSRYFLCGLGLWIGVQAIINIGAMIGIMPLTGVPLPLISYGGTALMVVLAASGIAYSIIKNNN